MSNLLKIKGFSPLKSLAPGFSRGILVLFLACQQPVEHNPLLVGQWRGVEWMINGERSGIDAAQVEFEFAAEGTYAARFGDQAEKGTWYTRADKLYTTAEGRKEIMVKLLKNDGQTLRFEMNRGGRPEELELRKQ
jgi:hypothetical protein